MTRTRHRLLVVLVAFASVVGSSSCTPPSGSTASPGPSIHPVFFTPVTGQSRARPAIQVEILDPSEHWFLTAELYLAVQSSRFPSGTWLLLPLNVGDFAGCRSRFVQLPFETAPGDVILFNLLDDDELTSAKETLILDGCRASGYCVLAAGNAYCPLASSLIAPAAPVAADLLGKAVIEEFDLHRFDNYGTAEFIVPAVLPSQPQQANKLTVLDDSKYARVVLKIYGPAEALSFSMLP